MHTKEYRSAKFKIAKGWGVKSVFCLKLDERGDIGNHGSQCNRRKRYIQLTERVHQRVHLAVKEAHAAFPLIPLPPRDTLLH
jgi:hypothetical protein